MKTHSISLVLLLAGTTWLAGCDRPTPTAPDTTASAPDSRTNGALRAAAAKIQEKLATENITLSSDTPGIPDAKITPQGELIVDGRKVEVDARQQALLIDYRTQLAAVAQAGANVGLEGAELAMGAIGEAVRGAFSGASEAEIEQRVEARAGGIKAQALQLCGRLPALLAAQEALAAAVPEFVPYAEMDAHDIEECGKDVASR